MPKLLVVEDEKDINDMIVHNLEAAGYEVESVYDGDAALKMLEKYTFNLIILDILLPGIDGWELCQNIRSSRDNGNIPIIFVTALSSENDKVKGFDLGCDDYLAKPFSPRELVSRVRAILKRAEQLGIKKASIRMGEIVIDFLKHKVVVGNRVVHLTGSEFQILSLLVAHEGRVYSRDELLSLMRENDFELELGNVDVHVHRLRQKIEKNPRKPEFIQTVWGVGYRFASN